MRFQIRRPSHPIHILEIVIHDQLHENRLDLQAREELVRTNVLIVPEVQHCGLRGSELVKVFLAELLAHIVIAKPVKSLRKMSDGEIILNGADGHGEVGSFGERGVVAECVFLNHDAVKEEHARRVEALAFLDETVKFAQFGEETLVPSVLFVARFSNFFPQKLDIFRI